MGINGNKIKAMLTLEEQQKMIDELSKSIDPKYFEIVYDWLGVVKENLTTKEVK